MQSSFPKKNSVSSGGISFLVGLTPPPPYYYTSKTISQYQSGVKLNRVFLPRQPYEARSPRSSFAKQ